jgi:hypothetical protein
MDFELTPVAGKSRRFSFWATLAVVSVMVASAFLVTPPQKAQAYTWSAWTTRYYTATTNECLAAKRSAAKFIGPIQTYGCTYRVRSRFAVIDDWAGYSDRIIQLENAAPYWASAWGMSLEVRVHWNGVRARYTPGSLLCRTWSFVVAITRTDCAVYGDSTSQLTIRMAYDASFAIMLLSGHVNRGAQQTVDKNGFASLVTRWP